MKQLLLAAALAVLCSPACKSSATGGKPTEKAPDTTTPTVAPTAATPTAPGSDLPEVATEEDFQEEAERDLNEQTDLEKELDQLEGEIGK